MNSQSSSSCLLAVIAIYVTVTAVSGAHIVSPPAKIAGHNANSLVGAGSRIIAGDNSTKIHCCDPHDTMIGNNSHSMCSYCTRLCQIGAMDAEHNSHLLRKMCRCYVISPCQHISYITQNKTSSYDGANHRPNNDGNHHGSHDNTTVVYGTFTTSVWYQLTFIVLSLVSCLFTLITMIVYIFLNSGNHSRFVKNLMMSILVSTYITLITEIHRKPTTSDFQSPGIYKLIIIIISNFWQSVATFELYNKLNSKGLLSNFIRTISNNSRYHNVDWIFQFLYISITICFPDIFHQVDRNVEDLLKNNTILGFDISIKLIMLSGLTPGLINIIIYLYLFKYKKFQLSSIEPDLLRQHAKKISNRNKMFKISALMFIIDFIYILDIIMEWDFTVIHILHLLKPFQGIFVSYLLLFRPFTPVIYRKLLKRLRRREESLNEETDNPIYTITTV